MGEELSSGQIIWLNGSSLELIALCLFNVVPDKIGIIRIVAEALHNNSWTSDIRRVLTVQVILEYVSIWELVQHHHLTADEDRLMWR
jgi:hypothetical protein